MSDAISKVLFINSPNVGGVPIHEENWTSETVWKEVRGRVKADGVSGLFISRAVKNFSPERVDGSKFVEVDDLYRKSVEDLETHLGDGLAYKFLREGKVDAVVVRSDEVIDIRAAVRANTWLQVINASPVPIILQVGEALLATLKRGATLAELQTFTPYGSNPNHPSNLSLSPEVFDVLTDSGHVRAIGPEALEFIKSLQRPTTVGEFSMLAELVPWIGGLLFDSRGYLNWFDSLLDGAHHLIQSVVAEFNPEAADSVAAHVRSKALKSALQKVVKGEVKIADLSLFDQSRSHARVMQFNPRAVARELGRLSNRRPEYETYHSELIGLVCSDLAGSKTAQEIKEAARSLLERGKVARKK